MPSPPRGYTQRLVEGMKTAVRDSLEQEKNWIKENYNRPNCEEELYDLPLPPMIYFRYYDLVYNGLTYFQVQKQVDDELFLNQIDKEQSIKDNSRMQSIIYDQLVILLLRFGDAPWKTLQKLSDAAKDTRFYHSAIHAAATFAFKLYTTKDLIRSGHWRLHCIELNKLWKMLAIPGGKGSAIDEFCKSILHIKIDKENYSLVTETDLYSMFNMYEEMYEEFLSSPELFQQPYKASISAKNKNKTPMQVEIKEVISKRKLPARSKVEVDEYTRFLITFVGQKNTRVIDKLRDEHMEMIDKEGLHALNPELLSLDEPSPDDIISHLEFVLNNLTTWRRDMIRHQLRRAKLALLAVVGESLIVANEVLEIVEVAELRRIALGSRFINRNHLIWAFYECGFGLPPEIRENLDLPIAEEDHPPYVIYLASRELATSSTNSGFEVGYAGEKKLHLEHFVFSILYAKGTIVDKNQVTEMEEHFRTFIEVVVWDGINRPNCRYEPLLKTYWSASEDEDPSDHMIQA